MINFDKFLVSFINEMKKYQPVTCYNFPGCVKKALEDQGLAYKDGEIVKTQRRISAEAKENGYGELEDEKIRTALIHFFSNSENTSFEYWEGIPKKEVLTWLEQQKSK